MKKDSPSGTRKSQRGMCCPSAEGSSSSVKFQYFIAKSRPKQEIAQKVEMIFLRRWMAAFSALSAGVFAFCRPSSSPAVHVMRMISTSQTMLFTPPAR